MIILREKDSGSRIGSVSEEEFSFLVEALEEESESDTDYHFTAETIDMLEGDGAPASLVAMLRAALEGSEGLDIEWSRE